MKTLSRPAALFILILAGALSANFVLAAGKIDINSAPLEDLIKIVHIGEARAKELISLRPFSSLDDLTKIKGIGGSRTDDIKKQGLAWVLEKAEDKPDEAEPQTMEASPPLNKELAASSLPLFIPVTIAIFSGIMVLILKKKLKVV